MYNQELLEQFRCLSDLALIDLYRKGEECAVAVLLARYASLINKKVFNYNICGVDTDDIKQEAYMGLFNAIRSFKSDKCTSFYTYANHCIANKLKNLFASASTNKANLNNNVVSFNEIDIDTLYNKNPNNPELIFIQNEGYQSLLKLIQSVLSDTERKVMLLYLSGFDYNYIASKLNSSQKSVDNALQRARRKLKAVLNNL